MSFDVWYENRFIDTTDFFGILVKQNSFNGIVNTAPGVKKVPYEVIDLEAGVNRTIRILARNPELDIVDVTGATAVFTVKATLDSSASITKTTATSGQGEIGAGDEGEIYFYIIPGDTSALTIRQYKWDVNITLANGKKYRIVHGVLNLIKRVGS